jgi:predicted amidohydrolase
MLLAPGDAERNTQNALRLIASAAARGAQVVLLPEALPFGWMDPSAASRAEGIPTGAFCTLLRNAAREHRLFICSGLVERASPHLFNAAVLIDPSGEVILHHRKIFELEMAHHLYSLGDKLGVAETSLGRIGLMICADGFAPDQSISRTLGLMGAELILSPCAWAVPPGHDNSTEPYGQLWLDNYGSVAREFKLWIAGCSNVGPIKSGPWSGYNCIGCSMVVGPAGTTVANGAYAPAADEIIYLDLPARPAPHRTAPKS